MEYYPVLRSKQFEACLSDILIEDITKFINSNSRIEDIKNISIFNMNNQYQAIVVYLYSLYENSRLVSNYQALSMEKI